MDPLSAYKMSAIPGLPPSALPASSPEETIGKIIPKGELDKLSSSVLQPKAYVPPSLSPLGGIDGASGTSFSSFLGHMVQDVSAKQAEASGAMKGVIAGNGVPLHQAMIAVEEASVSFQLMVEVRNRLLESYQELMRMQV